MSNRSATFAASVALALLAFAGSTSALAQSVPSAPAAPAQPAAPAGAKVGVDAALEKLLAVRSPGADGKPPSRQAMAAAINDAIGGLDLPSLGGQELWQISIPHGDMIGRIAPEAAAKLSARLGELAKKDDVEAVGSAIARLLYAGGAKPDQQRAAVEGVFAHPRLAEWLKIGAGTETSMGNWQPVMQRGLGALRMLDDEALAGALPTIVKGVGSLSDVPARSALALAGVVSTVADADGVTREQREPLRVKVLALVKSAREAMGAAPAESDKRVAFALDDQAKSLDGVLMRTGLIGEVAPAIEFTWATPIRGLDKPVTSLSDLRGKVVVLDFWATWCGPCVASFPNVRELQAHYKDSDVVILGVTSLQGYHITKDRKRVPAERGQTLPPQEEMNLMSEYIKSQDMTWPVAFSSANVFNPDYGIRGIPHVVIIDAQGKVRHRGLHPAAPKAEKIAKIDALLKEAGLKVPGADGTGKDAKPGAKSDAKG